MIVRTKIFILIISLLLAACGAAPVTTEAAPTFTQAPSPTVTPEASVTPVSTPTETLVPLALPVLDSPELAHIQMLDDRRGWGIATGGGTGAIVRTQDGGRTWLNATPPKDDLIGRSSRLFALDDSHVWVLTPRPDFYSSSLYRTADGINWMVNPVPFGSAYLQFLDASTGRALADRGAGAGSNAVGLYQTSDGGVTWTSVFHNDPTELGSSNTLPLSGIKNGMSFLTDSTGWVTGSVPVTGNVYLYRTQDGGASWAQVDVPLPFGYDQAMTMALPPIFFGQDGLFPLILNLPDSTSLLFFTSQDGGLTWSSAGRVPVQPGRYSFADATHGWAWDGTNALHLTSDGGQTWQALTPNLTLPGTLNQIQFVPSGSNSYTGWALSGLDEQDHASLYMTTDNGATWTPLIP